MLKFPVPLAKRVGLERKRRETGWNVGRGVPLRTRSVFTGPHSVYQLPHQMLTNPVGVRGNQAGGTWEGPSQCQAAVTLDGLTGRGWLCSRSALASLFFHPTPRRERRGLPEVPWDRFQPLHLLQSPRAGWSGSGQPGPPTMATRVAGTAQPPGPAHSRASALGVLSRWPPCPLLPPADSLSGTARRGRSTEAGGRRKCPRRGRGGPAQGPLLAAAEDPQRDGRGRKPQPSPRERPGNPGSLPTPGLRSQVRAHLQPAAPVLPARPHFLGGDRPGGVGSGATLVGQCPRPPRAPPGDASGGS